MSKKTQKKDLIKNSQSSMPKSKLSNQIVPWISIIISGIAILVSIYGLQETRTNRNLTYFLDINNVSYENKTMIFDIIFNVTNGAISEYQVLDYRNSEITEVAHNYANISKNLSPYTTTATYEMQFLDETEKEYIATFYLLIKGTDGSKHLDMVLFHVDHPNNTIKGKIYSEDELAFISLNPDSIYQNAYNNYIELYEQIKKYE